MMMDTERTNISKAPRINYLRAKRACHTPVSFTRTSLLWIILAIVTGLSGSHQFECKAQNLIYAAESHSIPSTMDSCRVSILIASPSADEVYTLYGHAGLRLKYGEGGSDVTFNWGIFDFDEPNFLGRFVEGRTDYMVKAVPTDYYLYEYYSRGSRVTEMTVNLNAKEKAKLQDYLHWNVRPENSRYRYSFFYDNCSNRVIKVLLDAMGGKILLPKEKPRTLRDIINHAEACMPWLVLGTDLTVAAPADQVTDEYTQLFLPERVAALIPKAYIQMPDGSKRPFITDISVHHSPDEERVKAELADRPVQTPLWTAILWCLLLVALTYANIRSRCDRTWLYRITTGVEVLTLILAGLCGSLLFYLAFFSEHPAMWPNYNMIVLHPLHLLLGIPLGFWRLQQTKRNRWLRTARCWYHFATFALLVGFVLAAWALPQHFNAAMYGFAVALIIISVHRLWIFRREDVSDGAEKA